MSDLRRVTSEYIEHEDRIRLTVFERIGCGNRRLLLKPLQQVIDDTDEQTLSEP